MLPCTCFTAPDASRQNQFSLATTKIYEARSRTTKTTCDASQRTKTPKQLLIPANRQPSMPVTQKKNSVEHTTSAPKHIASTSEIGLCHDQGLAGVESLASNPHRQPADSWSTRPCACKKTTHQRQRSHPMTLSRSFREIKEFPPGESCSRHGLLGESQWPGPGEPSSRQSWRQPC